MLAAFVLAALTLCIFPENAQAQLPVCDRTAQVQAKIIQAINGVSLCENVTFDHLKTIRSLTIRSNIDSLALGDFSGLPNLTHLNLNYNNLTTLPSGLFDALTSLTELNLRHNDLTELPDEVFDKLTSLTELNLRHNDLTELPDEVFDKLTSLTYLTLEANDLTELPDEVFDKLTSLTYLTLEANDLTELPDGVFDKLTRLTHLNLFDNALSELPDNVFDKLTRLTVLSLGFNALSELDLPAGVFDKLTRLTELDLRHNDLTELPDNVFDKLTSLTKLIITLNPLLTELPDNVFDNLTRLTFLSLSNSGLTKLPDNVFDKLTRLTFLSMGHNDLTELPDGVFDKLTSLTSLSLQANDLSELPASVFNNKLSRLEYLDLIAMDLETLRAGLFSGISNLTALFMERNPTDPFTLTMEPKQTGANTFEVEVVEGAPFAMTTTLSVRGGTLPGGDTLGTVTVPAGSITSDPITVTPTGTEPVEVTLGPTVTQPPTNNFRGIQTAVGGPLTLPGVRLSTTNVNPDEGSSENYTVKLNTRPSADVTITVARASGTEHDTDLTVSAGASLTFTTTNWDTPQTVTIAAAPDNDDVDGTATFAHTASSTDTGYAGISINSVTATEYDDDKTLTINTPSVLEGASGSTATLTYTVTLSAASWQDVTVAYADAGTGSATSGTDYTAITGATLTFAAGETTQPIAVTVTGDDLGEPDETIEVTLSNPSNAGFAEGATTLTGTGTITDDDATPTLTINTPSVLEGASGSTATLTYTVSLDQASWQDVTVAYADAGTGSATSGTDYTAITGATLTFAAGETTQPIAVTVTGDDLDEPDETIEVTLSNPSNAGFAEGATTLTGTGTITDDDATPTLTINTPSVLEGASGSTATLTYTVSLDQASWQDVTVAYADAGTGSATSGTDYTAITGATLTFAAGETTQPIAVTVTGDDLDEPDETIEVTLSNPSNAGFAEGATTLTGTGTITDDDATPTLTINTPSVLEGASGSTATLTYTVSLDQASWQDVTVAYADAGTGSATSGTDYTAITGATLTFAAGETTQPIAVTVTGDDLDEPDETIEVTLSSATNAGLAGGATTLTGTGTITDDDATPTLSINTPSVLEGASGSTATLTYTVTLSAASGQQVTVAYADAGTGSATVGTDYTAITGATLTFAAGETTQPIAVTVTGDDLDEPDETIEVTLSNPSNAGFAEGATTLTGTGTITDDDTVGVTVDPTDGLITTEAGDSATFTVVLESEPTEEVSIALSSSDPSEGAVVSASLTFTRESWNNPQTVTVIGMDDHEIDGPQTYTVVIEPAVSDDASYAKLDSDDVTVTNMDDDGAAIRARFRRLNDEILSKQALTLADVTIAAVTSRMDAGACAGQPTTVSLGGSSTLAEILRANAQTLTTGRLNLKQLLGTSAFRLRLTEDGSGAGPGCLTLWGQGDYRNLSSGGAQALDWDGDLLTGQVGADALLRPDLRAGLAVSWSDGAFDYTDRTTGMPISGDYSSRMVSVHPYVTWWSPMGLDLWATGGYGRGEIEIEDEEVGTHTSDTTLRLASVGASGPLPIGDALIAGGTTTLRLKAQVSLAQMDVAGHGSLLEEQTIAAQRLRLALEGSHERPLASGGSLTPSLEVGLRHDGGDGATGTGLELGGGLRYVDPALGLTLEGRGRVLAAYDDAYKEWGASGLIRLDPGAAGQGLSLSLAPSYGQTASGVQRLWDQGLPQGPTQGLSPTQALTGRLEAEVGYGLAAFAGQGLVTPYSAVTLGGGTQQYRVGSRVELGPELRLSLEGTRQVTAVGQADQGIRLQVDWQF